jgi:hypothetical protein
MKDYLLGVIARRCNVVHHDIVVFTTNPYAARVSRSRQSRVRDQPDRLAALLGNRASEGM